LSILIFIGLKILGMALYLFENISYVPLIAELIVLVKDRIAELIVMVSHTSDDSGGYI
jgi:hypothetical protein